MSNRWRAACKCCLRRLAEAPCRCAHTQHTHTHAETNTRPERIHRPVSDRSVWGGGGNGAGGVEMNVDNPHPPIGDLSVILYVSGRISPQKKRKKKKKEQTPTPGRREEKGLLASYQRFGAGAACTNVANGGGGGGEVAQVGCQLRSDN